MKPTKIMNKMLLAICVASATSYAHSTPTSRIINGSLTQAGSYPWMVSLQTTDGQHFCGGSLISDQWVMTAAHCVEDTQASSVNAVVGEYNLIDNNDGGEKRQISKILIHPKRNANNNDYDIALLKLSSSVTGTSISKVTSSIMREIALGTKFTVMGWGNMSTSAESYPEKLYEVQVPLVSNAKCNKSYNNEITNNMLCAGFPEGGKDSCQGDSGGPLVYQIDGKWLQVGIVSFGEGCAQPNFPGVYARVANFNEWINTQVADGSENGGTETGGTETGGTETGGSEAGGAEHGGSETGGTETGGAETEVTHPVSVGNNIFDLPELIDLFSVEGQEEKIVLVLKNLTNSDLTIQSIHTDTSEFSISGNGCNKTLNPEQSCKLTLTYTPTEATEVYGQLNITLADDSVVAVQLYGEKLNSLGDVFDWDDDFTPDTDMNCFSNFENWDYVDNGFSLDNTEINAGNYAVMTTEIEGPGTLDFDFGLFEDADANEVMYLVDNKAVRSLTGQRKTPAKHSTQLSAGKHRITWAYAKQENTTGKVRVSNITFKKTNPEIASSAISSTPSESTGNSLSSKSGGGGSTDIFLLSGLILLISGIRKALTQ